MGAESLFILVIVMVIVGTIGTKTLTLGKYDPARHTGNPKIDAVKERIGRNYGGCSVCGGTSFELGRLHGKRMVRFMPYGKAFIGGKYVVALSCDDCGHVMLFKVESESDANAQRRSKSVTVG